MLMGSIIHVITLKKMPEQTREVKLLKFGKKINMKAFQGRVLYEYT